MLIGRAIFSVHSFFVFADKPRKREKINVINIRLANVYRLQF